MFVVRKILASKRHVLLLQVHDDYERRLHEEVQARLDKEKEIRELVSAALVTTPL